jgi:hypothetical protein
VPAIYSWAWGTKQRYKRSIAGQVPGLRLAKGNPPTLARNRTARDGPPKGVLWDQECATRPFPLSPVSHVRSGQRVRYELI